MVLHLPPVVTEQYVQDAEGHGRNRKEVASGVAVAGPSSRRPSTLGMSIARRSTSTAFKTPISAPSFIVGIGHSSPALGVGQMAQVLDSKRARDY